MGNSQSACCTRLGSDPKQRNVVSSQRNLNQDTSLCSSIMAVQHNSLTPPPAVYPAAGSPLAQQIPSTQLHNSAVPLNHTPTDEKPVSSTFSSQNSAQHLLQAVAAASSGGETILTTTPVDANLDALILHLQKFLNQAKESSSSSSDLQNPDLKYWNYLEFSESNQLMRVKDILSESADGASDLVQSLSSVSHDGADALKSSAKTVLQAIGKSHWAAAGLLLVLFVLERLDRISENREECLDLLDEMYRLARYIRDLKRTPKIRPRVAELMEESLQLVAQGAILCCSRFQKSWISRFLGASVDAHRLKSLRKDLDKTHKHLMLEMMIRVYDAQDGIQFQRQKLYPKNAVGREMELRSVVEMLEFESDKNVVAVTLYGLGGIGKTTLGDAVYASVVVDAFRFSKVSLFDTIHTKPLLIEVQKAILDDISYARNSEPRSHTQGQADLLEVFQQYPCFVYIDNVLDVVELQKLLPPDLDDCKKLRLLLTARDANVRDGLDIQNPDQNKLLDVNCLPMEEASIVLRKHTGNSAQEIESEQFEKLLKICGGIPLCLEMVGRFIRNEPDKKAALNAIMEEQKHDGDGQSFAFKHLDFFQFAFNGLNQSCKDAFLDICVCVLENNCSWYWMVCNFGEGVVKILKNRGLIRKVKATTDSQCDPFGGTEDSQLLEVHDVVIEMGRKILNREGIAVRSWKHLRRLLEADDNEATFRGIRAIHMMTKQVLKENAQEKAEILKVPASKLDLASGCLRHFCNFMHEDNRMHSIVQIEGTCRATFKNLLSWNCPSWPLPFDASECKRLKALGYSPIAPVDLSQFPKYLRVLRLHLADLGGETLPISLGKQKSQLVLPHLQLLLIYYENHYSGSWEMPDDLYRLDGLQHLWIWNCRWLSKIPGNIEKCRGLRSLAITNSEKLEQLPEELCLLSSLQRLDLRGCVTLRKLPDKISMLSSLSSLLVGGCKNLVHLGVGFDSLLSLQLLDLSGCSKLGSGVIDKITKMRTLIFFRHESAPEL